MRRQPFCYLLAALILVGIAGAPMTSRAAFTTFAGCWPISFSDDGSIVAGYAGSQYPCIGDDGGSVTDLGTLKATPGPNLGQAHAISSDGSTVVGHTSSDAAVGTFEAFRWTSGGGMVGLGGLPGGDDSSGYAYDVSADGSVIVGQGYPSSGWEAFRWTSAGGMVGLGGLTGPSVYSTASAVSADGSIVVGDSNSASGTQAFRWTSAGGMVGLGDLSGGSFDSEATAISADGSTIVGNGTSANGGEAFRWTSAGGMVALGDLPGGGFYSEATAVSGDGSVVLGWSYGEWNEQIGFLWTEELGMVELRDYLESVMGYDLSALWNPVYGTDISNDGLTILGFGGSFTTNAWIADIVLVPEPSTALLLGMGLIGLASRRRSS